MKNHATYFSFGQSLILKKKIFSSINFIKLNFYHINYLVLERCNPIFLKIRNIIYLVHSSGISINYFLFRYCISQPVQGPE